MPRPKKAIVEYFPHYVSNGKSIFSIENRYGNDGYAFWFKLLEILGSSEHHFIDCNDANNWEYILAKTRIKEEQAKDMLELLAKLDCINKALWEMKIIRSDNFLINLDVVYKRRKFDIITNAEVAGLCKQKLPPSGINVNNNSDSVGFMSTNVDKVKYSKVKESKGEERKEKKNKIPEYLKYSEHFSR